MASAEGTRTLPSRVLGSLPGIYQWESLAALVRDISNLQDQHQQLSEKLWHSGRTVQQLTVQATQLKTSLAQSDRMVRQVQEELQLQRQSLQREQKERDYAKKSLAHEFSLHAQTEKSLDSEREMNHKLVSLYNQFDLTKASLTSGVTVPEDLKLGSILEENSVLKRAIGEYKVRIEKEKYSNEASIEMLKREKQDVLDALDEKSIELSQANDQLSELCHQCCSDNSEDKEGVQIETAMVAKRKRLGE